MQEDPSSTHDPMDSSFTALKRGYAHCLTPRERRALLELSKLVADSSIGSSEIVAARQHGHESMDAFLCRFLRARDFCVQKAFSMVKTHVAWRVREDVSSLANKEEGMVIMDCNVGLVRRLLFPSWVSGFTKEHCPVVFLQFGRLDARKLLRLMTLDEIIRLHVWELEQLLRLMAKKTCEEGAYVDRWVTVCDLK